MMVSMGAQQKAKAVEKVYASMDARELELWQDTLSRKIVVRPPCLQQTLPGLHTSIRLHGHPLLHAGWRPAGRHQ